MCRLQEEVERVPGELDLSRRRRAPIRAAQRQGTPPSERTPAMEVRRGLVCFAFPQKDTISP